MNPLPPFQVAKLDAMTPSELKEKARKLRVVAIQWSQVNRYDLAKDAREAADDCDRRAEKRPR